MNKADFLKERFLNRTARVAVIGMGYVGYPMAELSARAGFPTIGIELDEDKVEQVNRGESYIQDVDTENVKPLVDAGTLKATTDYSAVKDVEVVIITVPTPLNKTGDPDVSFIISALNSMKPYFHSGMLLILESTTYPGTTEEMFVPEVESFGLKVGEDIFIAFSPERIDPGNPVYGVKNTPKVVGGLSSSGTDVACAFYNEIVDTVVPVSSSAAAEMVKLYENTFRAINIGLANELAIICNLLDVDVWEIINAAKTKPFGFMPFFPGPGLGGHCIPIDPSYLSWKMRSLKYKTRFIELATEINTHMPEYTVSRAMELLNVDGKPLKGAKILLLGMAYKNDIDDLRESPALDVFTLLVQRGADVIFSDPYCPTVKFDSLELESTDLTPQLLKEQDLVIITTAHQKVDYQVVADNAQLVFDARNAMRDHVNNSKAKIEFL